MRFVLSIATLLLFSVSFSTCTMYGPGTRSVVLIEQPLLVEIGDDLAKDTIPEGSSVSYLGEKSLDSAYVKVMFEGGVGWIPAWTVAIDAEPAFVNTAADVYRWQGSGDLAGKLTANWLVAVDTTVLNRSHIFYLWGDGEMMEGWVPTDVIVYDLSAREYIVEDYTADVDYYEGDRLTLDINFDGVSQEIIDQMTDHLSITSDIMANQIILTTSTAEAEIENIVNTLVPASTDGDSWRPDTRVYYFWAYQCVVPGIIDIGVRTDYAQYVDEQYKTQLQSVRAFLMKRVDRSPKTISMLYETFGGMLKQQLAAHDVSEEITGLIVAYDHLRSLPDYHAKCANVINQVWAWDQAHADQNGVISGGFILGDQRPLYAPILGPDAASEGQYETSIIWRYSFWLRRMAEGNDAVVYNILRDLAGYSTFKGGEGAAGEVQIKTCKFEDYSIGDCGHMLFDCGDYGDADTQQLSTEELALWNDLVLADRDGERGNPKYVGKSFRIKLGSGIGSACNEGQGGLGEVPVLLEFKLK